MTERPWEPEHAVSSDQARRLIGAQFPDFVPVRLAPLGDGWDNSAFLVNDDHVFRFPRREIAVQLIGSEVDLLPFIARRVPLPVPVPRWIGRPAFGYPWPFAGYRVIAGRTACSADLDMAQRERVAPSIARFLAALHAIPADEAAVYGAAPDPIRRLDIAHRGPQVLERLRQCVRLGLIEDARPWTTIVGEILDARPAEGRALVHGDLYARHLLVDDAGAPSGVIDWGDVHLGDPAIDLALAHGFLPPSAHDAFRAAYGPIDADTWRLARFKALHSAAMILVYGHDTGDTALVREGLTALAHLNSGPRD